MKNSKAIKRAISSVMALAVALTMCMVATPMKVFAATSIVFTSTGLNDGGTHYGSGDFTTDVSDISTYVSYDPATKTVTLKNAVLSDIGAEVTGFTYVIQGNCSIGSLGLTDGNTTNIPATIRMTKGATLTIGGAYTNVSGAGAPAAVLPGSSDWNTMMALTPKLITVEYGTLNADGTITVSTDAPGADNTASDVKVGNSVQEKDKTEKDSATYKVTNTDDGKRSVTYEKPADNASGTEEVKAEVTLADNKTYKVTAIAESAFASFGGKDNITAIKIGDNVEEIGGGACKDCPKLTSVTFGANVKNIGANAFAGCTALTSANLNDNVETIGASAFEKTKITKVTLGKKVKKVGKKAYYQCGSLKSITVKSTKLTKKSKVGKNAFGKINKKAKFKVKMGKKDAAKYKDKTIKVFKNKSIGYVSTWKVS